MKHAHHYSNDSSKNHQSRCHIFMETGKAWLAALNADPIIHVKTYIQDGAPVG